VNLPAASLEAGPASRLGLPAYPLTPGRPADPAPPILLKLARNESTLFLLEVNGAAPDRLQVDTEGPQGAFQVWHLRPLPAHLPDGLYPDGLVPLGAGLSLPGAPAVLAVRVAIPPGHPAGVFRAAIKVTSPAGSAVQPLSLVVWRFTLPEDLPITLLANFRPVREWFRRYGLEAPADQVAVWEAYLRFLRRYKVNAIAGLPPLSPEAVSPNRPVTSFEDFTRLWQVAFQELGYRRFRLPAALGVKAQGSDSQRLQKQASVYFPEMRRFLEGQGMWSQALVKLWDEPPRRLFPQVAGVYRQLKEAMPGLALECSGEAPSGDLTRVVDIWTVSARAYQAEALAAARRQGQELWLYHNRLHGADRPPAHQRLIGWQVFCYDFSGYYLWGVNVWPEDPWTEPPGPAAKLRRGTFVYPHPRTGLPLPTLRLEAFHRGWQDYLHLALLAQAAQQGRLSPAAWQQLRQQAGTLAGDLTNLQPQATWRDMEALRQKMGELLDRAEEGGSSPTPWAKQLP
jgi:hypothetical protein